MIRRRNRTWKRFWTLLLGITLCFSGTELSALAAPETVADTVSDAIPEGVILNYREVEPIDTSFADETAASRVWGVLPSSYSSSSKLGGSITVAEQADYVTGVKYQNGGTCWAHAATSVAESSYIINHEGEEGINSDQLDFNEYHLVHYTYHTPKDSLHLFGGDYNENTSGKTDLGVGGNNIVTLYTYANWIGASDSTDFTSGQVSGENPDALGYEDAAHMENGYILTMPDMTIADYQTDMDVIKQMIMDHGSVSISYYATTDSGYYKNGYQYYDQKRDTNHAVTVVGWDDNIPASSFATQPEGNGAWLVKNSWSTGWGLGGYFWLSYYDKTIYKNAFAWDFENGSNYDNNYQYDGSAYSYGKVGYYINQASSANAFVADSAESLEAVGFFTDDVNMDYEIRVYRNLESGALPQTGSLAVSQSGTQTYAGFHTVALGMPVNIKEGERYAVVVTLKKADSWVSVPSDGSYSWGWITFHAYAKAGESYAGSSVDTLADVNPDNVDYAEGKNVRIKAFTNELDVKKVTGVSLNQTSAVLSSGQTLQLTATVSPADATFPGVNYTSSDDSLATVDSTGLVQANTTGKAGTATITVTTEDGNKTASCSVTVEPVKVSKVTLDRKTATLTIGVTNTLTLKAAVAPGNATNKAVTWKSSNPSVATVSSAGKVTAVGEGTATIIATAQDGSGVKDICEVTVYEKKAVTGVSLNQISAVLSSGQSLQLTATVSPADATFPGVSYTSSDDSLATVDNTGLVQANTTGKAGTVTITVTTEDGNKTASCSVTIEPVKVTKLTLNKTDLKLTKGKTYALKATISPANATNKAVTWKSSTPKVATVTSGGVVKAVSGGAATITATAKDGSGVKATCKVTVPYSITYKLNNGTNHKSNPTSYYEQKITLKNPTRKGYIFKGWYTDSKYKNKITSISKTAKKNYTLYAKWEKVSVKKVTLSSVTNVSGKKAKLVYKKLSGVSGYEISYSIDKKFAKSKTKTVTTTKTSYTLSKLTKNKTYYVRMRAYQKDSTGKKVYGSYSRTMMVKIKK